MKILQVCRICDRILGEIELDDLTNKPVDPIIDVVGNVAYAFCLECRSEMEIAPQIIYQ